MSLKNTLTKSYVLAFVLTYFKTVQTQALLALKQNTQWNL